MGNKPPKKLSPTEIRDLQKEVDFTGEEINDWYKEYMRSCRHGKYLTVKEFSEVYSSTFGGDAGAFANHVFRTFDSDGDGKVDFREFLVGLSVTASSNLEKKLRWAFKMYDIDGNGRISKDEILSLMTAVYKMTPQIKKPSDVSTPEKMTKKLFKKLDTDKNGELSWEEFYEGARRDQLVVAMLELSPD
ncbi:hypothetical protein FSP39_011270 [Pinctada imbricata]|uniref:EF-hand domain-containing protein n=1 Tax=Pinctada imbricata TaxID=66713 RepID=A0AA89BTG7_PINIB|nr:hypothetical protein FSP39_011270 [Pinctada imbricata]